MGTFWFFQIAVGSIFIGMQNIRGRGRSGQHDGRKFFQTGVFLDNFCHLQAVFLGNSDIQKNQVWVRVLGLILILRHPPKFIFFQNGKSKKALYKNLRLAL